MNMMLENAGMRSVFSGIEYRVARSRDELAQAYRLVYEEYLKQGYIHENASQMRLSLHNLLPETTTFIAKVDSTVIATATVIQDSPLGLPMDELYRDELQELRDQGRRLCEVSMLAHNSDLLSDTVPMMYNAKKMFLIFFLFKHVFDYVVKEEAMDYICITVNPKHAAIYESLLFKNLNGEVKYYKKVNGAPAVAKILNLATIEQELAIAKRQNIHRMFFVGQTDDRHFDGKFRFGLDDIKYFFIQQVNAFANASPEEIKYVMDAYPEYDLTGVIPRSV